MNRNRRNRTRGPCLGKLLAAACAVAAVCAPTAAADSLTFIKDDNVWLANPDGSGQHQVTLDGTASAPYESPSQADDGTIVALRQTSGERTRIYRLTQSGRLLNEPINTPAPGTGAMHAKVSPNGGLVAYWFVTTVRDPLCGFCVDLAQQVLISRSDRFTPHAEIGTPGTGSRPSWIGNDTLVMDNGSAEFWYYELGMAAADEWFTEGVFIGGGDGLQTLLDAEVAPTQDLLAVVRGNHQEAIRILELNGAPPQAPTPLSCNYVNPSGKFADPTWTRDGERLAWQEDDGVWLGDPGDPSCPNPELVIPGASAPDFSPAAINPGARPPCGNPGNPTACEQTPPKPQTCASCTSDPRADEPAPAIRRALDGVAASTKRRLARLSIRGLLRKGGFTIAFTAPSPGMLTVQLRLAGASRTVLARGRHAYTAAGKAKLKLKLTSQGRKRLRKARRLTTSLKLSFKPRGQQAISTSRRLRLKR